MAVIQTPKGRVIGLIVKDEPPVAEPEETKEEKADAKEEAPKRGRPKRQ